MYTGNIESRQQLISKVVEQAKSKKDHFAYLNTVRVNSELGLFGFKDVSGEARIVSVSDNVVKNIQYQTKLPSSAWKWFKNNNQSAHLATALNDVLAAEEKKVLIRTFNGDINAGRAILSTRYARLDHTLVLKHVLPVLDKHNCTIESANLDDGSLSVKVSLPDSYEIRPNDVVKSGRTITNNETGNGSLGHGSFSVRLVCTNGMTVTDTETWASKRHSGKNAEYTSQRELEAKIIDFAESLDTAFDSTDLSSYVRKLQEALEEKILGTEAQAIEALQEMLGSDKLGESEAMNVKNHYLAAGDKNYFGIVQAITRTAQDAHSFGRASELERLGSVVLDWPARKREAVLIPA